MSNAILRITDGTPGNTVDLISPVSGFHLKNWTPNIPTVKGGGVWQNSPLADGKRLVQQRWDNPIDTFELAANDESQDELIVESLRKLRGILQMAREYWTTTWQTTPVYIEARGSNETNVRYAVIYDWSFPADNNPYATPFFGCPSALDNLDLIVEHGMWLGLPPGESECVELGNIGYFDTVQSTQLLSNTGFESLGGGGADVFANWIESTSAGAPCFAAVYADTAFVHAGTYACRLNVYDPGGTPPCTARAEIYQDFATVALTSYVLRFYYATLNLSNQASCYFYIYDNTHGAYLYGPTALTPQTVWTLYTRPFTTPAGTIWVRVGFYAETSLIQSGKVDFYIDDVTVNLTDEETITSGKFTPTCEAEIYVGNNDHKATLTDVYYYDASLGVYSVNLIYPNPPIWNFDFLPAIPAANDLVYFGINSATENSGPFSSIIFDISVIQVDITAGQWEYWSGASWTAFTSANLVDNTAIGGIPFSILGVNSVHFIPPTDWATTVINGVTAWWVRYKVTAVGAAPTSPEQIIGLAYDQTFYSVHRASVDIENEITGDIPAIAQIKVDNRSDSSNMTPTAIQRVIVGLRKVSRGANFQSSLNTGNQFYYQTQNPPGTTIAVTGCSNQADATSPTGRSTLFNPGGAATGAISIRIGQESARDFYGTYHAYGRVYRNSAVTSVTSWLEIIAGGFYTSPVIPVDSNSRFWLLDYGQIVVPNSPEMGLDVDFDYIYFTVNFETEDATPNLTFYDLILIPMDECAIDTFNALGNIGQSTTISYREYLSLDSVGWPRISLRSAQIRISNDALARTWGAVNNSPLVFQVESDQRVYFLFADASGSGWIAHPSMACTIQAFACPRYLSMRGNG